MDTYVVLADIGRATVILFSIFAFSALAIYIHAACHNKTKMKAAPALNPKNEAKVVFHPLVASSLGAFSLLAGMYAADSLVARILLGIAYLAAAVFLFKHDK